MRLMRKLFLGALALWALPALADDLAVYTGRYQQDDGHVLIVTTKGDSLGIRPVFWRSTQMLVRVDGDRFRVVDRPDRTALFRRDGSARVVAVETTGLGSEAPAARIRGKQLTAAELLLNGNGREAARALEASRPDAVPVALDFAKFVNRSLPTRAGALASFLEAMARQHPRDAALQQALGDALVAAGRREAATAAYTAASGLDPANTGATAALRMIDHVEPSGGWSVPFKMGELFAAPTKDEVSEVEAMWAARDLRARSVQIEWRTRVEYEYGSAEIRILSHRIHGARHYGAVIVPVGAATSSCAVVVEAKGVSPSFFPLDLDQPPYTIQFLGKAASRFIVVLPSYRGEIIKLQGQTFTSEGDRSDAWDGAADDAIAFLNAVLKVTPEANSERVGVFGKSRGGTVALLAAIRDPRFKSVVAWSGPTDHFAEMVQAGWTPRERTAEGLRQKSSREQLAGQFIETFLRPAIEGESDLREVRLHMIASSPLYFAERLPPTQIHYGDDDNVVCPGNGRALEKRVLDKSRIEAWYYAEAGHDLDRDAAFANSKRFILRMLDSPSRGGS